MYTSTGTILSTPCRVEYVGNGPPVDAQAPIAMHHFGSGIWSHTLFMTGAIFNVGVPATIIRSDCRGLGRNTPAPNLSMSKREAPVAIISIAQQARPNVIGQRADFRAQLNTKSTVVVIIPLDDSIVCSVSFAISSLVPSSLVLSSLVSSRVSYQSGRAL